MLTFFVFLFLGWCSVHCEDIGGLAISVDLDVPSCDRMDYRDADLYMFVKYGKCICRNHVVLDILFPLTNSVCFRIMPDRRDIIEPEEGDHEGKSFHATEYNDENCSPESIETDNYFEFSGDDFIVKQKCYRTYETSLDDWESIRFIKGLKVKHFGTYDCEDEPETITFIDPTHERYIRGWVISNGMEREEGKCHNDRPFKTSYFLERIEPGPTFLWFKVSMVIIGGVHGAVSIFSFLFVFRFALRQYRQNIRESYDFNEVIQTSVGFCVLTIFMLVLSPALPILVYCICGFIMIAIPIYLSGCLGEFGGVEEIEVDDLGRPQLPQRRNRCCEFLENNVFRRSRNPTREEFLEDLRERQRVEDENLIPLYRDLYQRLFIAENQENN